MMVDHSLQHIEKGASEANNETENVEMDDCNTSMCKSTFDTSSSSCNGSETFSGYALNVLLDPVIIFYTFNIGHQRYLMALALMVILTRKVDLVPPRNKDLQIFRFGLIPMAAFQTCLQVWVTSFLLADGLVVVVQVMEVLMSLQVSQMETDDPTTSYMLHASVVEEKATACSMLCCYVDELKEGFFPWIDQVGGTLVPLLKFYFHEEVRKIVLSAMPELLRYAKLAIEKGQSHGRDVTSLKFLTDSLIPALVEALHKEPDIEIWASMLDSLNECLQIFGMLFDESQVRSIVDEIK
ncbi:hypothetical protein JHK86_009833 [Glycine max]|nr:hypothetical protein JHK86_009833 [Glycine max]